MNIDGYGCGAVLCVAAMLSPAIADVDVAENVAQQRVWQHDDGHITAFGREFNSWSEYIASDEFRAQPRRCGHEVDMDLLPLADPELARLVGGPEDCSSAFTNPLAQYDPAQGLYRIPVVVHVIRTSDGMVGHVSEDLVQSQIDVLNEDFRALSGAPGGNGVDAGIEFFLASFDPQGNPTNGITYTNNSFWHNDGPGYWDALSWDPTRYINIYTLTPGPGVLGYVPYLPQTGPAGSMSDRIVVLWAAFGRNSIIGHPYNQGRTGTHEVGHYLGLFHVFQSSCTSPGACQQVGDRICDTFPQQAPRFGCPTDPVSCDSPDNPHNYMDYTDDPCLEEFTPEQVRRMRCTLQHYRPGLVDPLPPPNDTCQDAIALFRGQTGVATAFATPEFIGSDCGSFDADVWFTYFSGTIGDATISICNATFDAEIAVYDGCPSGSNIVELLDCDTDGCGIGAQVSFTTEPLTTYWVRVGGAGGESGSGQMSVIFTPAPDCNGNGVIDIDEIESAAADDCNNNNVPDECELGEFGQWASDVDGFTSQFGPGDYSAAQALGAPDVFTYGDSPNAWTASQQNGSEETLTLSFNTPVYSSGIMIRETWGAGMITRVDVLDNDNMPETVWTGVDPSQPGAPRQFEIDWPTTPYTVRAVRLYVDTDATPDWEEIDAVRLYGFIEPTSDDCDDNGIPDACDAAAPTGDDCNNNAVLDRCEILLSAALDCDNNGLLDTCELSAGADDCNRNNQLDACETDCDANGVPDECDLATDPVPDCNNNGIPDNCDRRDAGWWATDVFDFSSEFASGNYAATQVLGPPDVLSYGDSPLAWSPANRNGSREFITTLYPVPVFATGAVVYETLGGGFVYQIDVIDTTNRAHTVWVGDDPSPQGELVEATFNWPQTAFPVWGLRVWVDTDTTAGWEEIDAIRLRGGLTEEDCNGNGIEDEWDILFNASNVCKLNSIPDECESGALRLYASSVVDFSSQFSNDDYSAQRALLGPSVFTYGSNPDAWVAASQNGSQEYLTVAFDWPLYAESLTVRESWGAGSVTQIELIDHADQPHTVWQGVDPSTAGPTPVDFEVAFDRTDYLVKAARIHIDTNATPVWEEIDAIAIYGYPDGATDFDNDGEPDDCGAPVCRADCSPDNGDGTFGNGVVNIDDLLMIVSSFGKTSGPCDISPANADGTFGDGVVDIDDLLQAISEFGECD